MSVRAKICGLSTPEPLDAAIAGGASHVGFVHYPRSARHLPLDRLAELRRRVPDTVEAVAVLVDPDDALLDLIEPIGLTLQLHRITVERAASIRRRWTGGLWVGLPCSSIHDLATATTFAPHADRILFDAPTDVLEVPGGTGRSFDWALLSEAAPAHPWILSGGLTPENVADAIAATGTDFVDVSSGVESAPGVKDVDKVAAFLTACRP